MPDTPRKWSLDLNEDKEPQPTPTKICPDCQAVVPAEARICTNCGYEFEFVDWINGEGELSQVLRSMKYFLDIAEKHAYKKYWAVIKTLDLASSYDDFLSIAQAMNYKKGWTWHQ